VRILDTRSKEKLVSHEDCDNNNDIPSACHKLNPSDLRFSVNWNKFLMQLEQIFHDFLHSCIWTYIQLVALQLSLVALQLSILNMTVDSRGNLSRMTTVTVTRMSLECLILFSSLMYAH